MWRSLVPVLAAFVVGLWLGRSGRPTDRGQPQANTPHVVHSVTIRHCNDVSARPRKMETYRQISDNRSQCLRDPPGDGEVWRIDLNDGEVTLFVTPSR